ncbi:hypothetical protein BS47DRAFT_74167 [Hydnum rufescens UP504]|uniref:Uncharacterized protein n=1 Tax=Hydnum rufescens UP504 TaxID=1448309 RepID=A0A9P6DZ57_9AGAM|nr:hypothetical protein BS47DRAFT_74167 [Hydnum rufescens UP504]
MPYDECLRLHFQFYIRMCMYLASPRLPPPVPTYIYCMDDVDDFQQAVGIFDGDDESRMIPCGTHASRTRGSSVGYGSGWCVLCLTSLRIEGMYGRTSFTPF